MQEIPKVRMKVPIISKMMILRFWLVASIDLDVFLIINDSYIFINYIPFLFRLAAEAISVCLFFFSLVYILSTNAMQTIRRERVRRRLSNVHLRYFAGHWLLASKTRKKRFQRQCVFFLYCKQHPIIYECKVEVHI